MKDAPQVPALKKGDIRIMPLGGVEEIGRNMTAVEYDNEIIVVDAGFQFESKETPGVDYILANTGYLRDNKHKIKAVVITHGHLDHIGGLPYLMNEIGNVPIYSANLIITLIKARQEEFPHSDPLDLRVVEGHEKLKVGENLGIEFFSTTHTFPDSLGVIINTPLGGVAVTGDIKLDHRDGVPTQAEVDNLSKFKDNPPLVLLMDSTNTSKPGWSIPEHRVFETFEKIIGGQDKGRLIIGTFASQLERLAKLVEISEKHGKKVVLEGRSMKQNMAIAEQVSYFTPKKGTIINVEQVTEYEPSKVVILATGAQGDEYASLMRIGKKDHKNITLTKDDTVVLSSSVIPGNEQAVQKMKDLLSRQGAHIVTFETSDVHASGHGYMEEAKWIHQKINPKFFIPQHGHYHMLRVHADIIHNAIDLPYDHIQIPDGNSAIIEVQENGTKFVQLKEKVASATRVVEGHKITDIQTTVMRDRKDLSEEGIFMIVVTIDQRTGKLRKSPDIISRGFIYLRESQDLLHQTRIIIKNSVEYVTKGKTEIDTDRIKADIATQVQKYLMQQTHKRPIVIPVVVSV
jgi:ribonuclease J